MTTKKELHKTNMAAARQQLLTLLQSLTPAQWEQSVFSENEAWTVGTMVSHLLEAERGMSIQVHKTRKGEPTIPENFDLERWNAGTQKRMGQLTPPELLSALDVTRAKTLEVLDSLRDEEWTLVGRHPSRGLITIEQYYETIAGHDLLHAQDIRAALG